MPFGAACHDFLVSKLRKYSFAKPAIGCACKWLENCTQRIVINGSQSSWTGILSWVPQGSVLNPFLFKIFINDLEKGMESKLVKLAGNIKLRSVVSILEDKIRIQNGLDSLA